VAPIPAPPSTFPALELTIDLSELVDRLAQAVIDLLDQRTARAPVLGFLDVAGAAEFLCCPTSRIYALTSKAGRGEYGGIPFHRDGSRLLFDPAELRAYVRGGGANR
jgi:hypothetical protein